MSDMTCPQCDAEVGEKGFCPKCGASLEPRSCPSCGDSAPAGSRFCTKCGSPLAGVSGEGRSESRGDGALGWWVAGLIMTALIIVVIVSVLEPDRGLQEGDAIPDAGAAQGGTGAGADGGTDGGLGPAPDVDISSMTPRQAADRLFDRVMRAGEAGDTAQVMQFLPMAIGAYERARPLDSDGLFHLSVLQRTGEQFEEALRTASTGLEEDPDHLLLLSAAAEAARQLEDTATARAHYAHLLEVYDEERSSDLEDYRIHSALLPVIRDDAESFLEGS
ncbi:MAG: double zinc ribbon domain-containing protein [Gemmatimonadota bacterium]